MVPTTVSETVLETVTQTFPETFPVMVPAPVECPPTRLALFWRWFRDAVLVMFVIPVIVATPFLLYLSSSAPQAETRRDYWIFAEIAASDDALSTWAERQNGFGSVRVERVEPDALILGYRSENRAPLRPDWETLGYSGPELSSSDVREASKKADVFPPSAPAGWWVLVLAEAIACAVLYRRTRRAQKRGEPILDLRAAPGLGWWRTWILGGVGVAALAIATGWTLDALGLAEAATHSLDGVLRRLSLTARIPFFVLVVMVVPVLEEWLFRGMLFSRFSGNGYVVSGAIVSAVAFALAHGIPVLIPHYVGAGLILAWVCYRTGSLWAPITLHAVVNGCFFVAELW